MPQSGLESSQRVERHAVPRSAVGHGGRRIDIMRTLAMIMIMNMNIFCVYVYEVELIVLAGCYVEVR